METVSLFHTVYLFKILLHCLKVDVVWCAWREGEGERGEDEKGEGGSELSHDHHVSHDHLVLCPAG